MRGGKRRWENNRQKTDGKVALNLRNTKNKKEITDKKVKHIHTRGKDSHQEE